MRIPVIGFDPSMRNWGMASGMLDLEDGTLHDLKLGVIKTKPAHQKDVRVVSQDLASAFITATEAFDAIKSAKIIFAEMPVGSQSASGMKGYGICVGIMAAMQVMKHRIIQVTPDEVKIALSGDKNASKTTMIQEAMRYYPEANWPMQKGKVVAGTAEHMADAVGAIHAGVQTTEFTNIMNILKGF